MSAKSLIENQPEIPEQTQKQAPEQKIDGVKNKFGTIAPFKRNKIESSIQKASKDVPKDKKNNISPEEVKNVTDAIINRINNPKDSFYVSVDDKNQRIIDIENIISLIEIELINADYGHVAIAFMEYRKTKEIIRKGIKVKKKKKNSNDDVTDTSMLIVESITTQEASPWDHNKIIEHIQENTAITAEIAKEIAKSVEQQIIKGGIKSVSTQLIREMVNNEISERGLTEELKDLSSYVIPKDFINGLVGDKSVENSNISNNNPEAVNLAIAELTLKQWALDTIFSPTVKKAHENGIVYVHDLGYPTRVYCSSHSLEYIKKYGLVGLLNLNTESKPARSASVLTGHLNTFLASMQANYAGALGIAYVNVMYAPYLENCDYKRLKQVAQEMIFNGSQNAFSRGGQSLFIDFNIHSGVPTYLKNVPAIGAGGQYMLMKSDETKVPLQAQYRKDRITKKSLMSLYEIEDGKRRLVLKEIYDKKAEEIIYDPKVQDGLVQKNEKIVTYGDYEQITCEFAKALLEVWRDGDKQGRIFAFPKCDFHVSAETFTNETEYQVFQKACELASHNGSTYFVFDRDAVTLSACCRLRTTIGDKYVLQHPESLRFCGFQNVTINIPQAAYRAAQKGAKNIDGIKKEIDDAMDIAMQAHLEKKEFVANAMSKPGGVLWQIGKEACDGSPYVDLESATYIMGIIGVNDAVKFLIGQEMHESNEAFMAALKITNHMFIKAKALAKKHKLNISLEESPAESAARKLAKIDLTKFKNEASTCIKGGDDAVYYTNSIHLAAEANISLVERIRKQSKFHNLIESGAMIHAFVGEEKPSSEIIAKLIQDTFTKTQCAQLTISPEFTYCYECGCNMRGLQDKCEECHSENIVHETRIVGYFSKIENWNKSKRFGELIDRHKGHYSVMNADAVKIENTGNEDDIDEQENVKCDGNSCTIG